MSLKRIWNRHQALTLLDVLQYKIEGSAWNHKPIQFLPDDFYDVKDAFDILRRTVEYYETNTEEWE